MIGILGLQGCIDPHEKHFSALGISTKRVRSIDDFRDIRGLVLPGGESTTMLHLLKVFGLVEILQSRAKEIPYWGICAGAILMAKELVGKGPGQFSCSIMNFTAERNAYGRQLESFTDMVELANKNQELATYIRAPKFIHWSATVRVSGRYNDDAVFLEEGQHMVTAFHPELSENLYFHKYFADKCY